MLEVREVPGKGRGVFASRAIAAGEVVLREGPLLLYPQHGTAAAFCSYCLRAFNSLEDGGGAVVPCAGCGRVGFCGSACAAAAAADPGSHCAAVCALLAACNSAGLSDEQQSALQFLVRCTALRGAALAGDAAAGARCAALAALAAPPALPPAGADDAGAGAGAYAGPSLAASDVVVAELHGRLALAAAAVGGAAGPALPLGEARELLRRDEANGYGIMAPSAPDGERRIRGTGLYARASLINHDCLPNTARFDAFDAPPGGGGPGDNAALAFRALHDIPAGEEVTLSYFPLTWRLAERRQRCRADYGFECGCPRCVEEGRWSEDGGSEWGSDGSGGGMEEDEHGGEGGGGGAQPWPAGEAAAGGAAPPADVGQEQEGGADPAYISMFLHKFVCPADGCGGTLAPLPPGAAPPGWYECNMCGGRRSEAQFLAELEAGE